MDKRSIDDKLKAIQYENELMINKKLKKEEFDMEISEQLSSQTLEYWLDKVLYKNKEETKRKRKCRNYLFCKTQGDNRKKQSYKDKSFNRRIRQTRKRD